jgi:hypothetical protein
MSDPMIVQKQKVMAHSVFCQTTIVSFRQETVVFMVAVVRQLTADCFINETLMKLGDAFII